MLMPLREPEKSQPGLFVAFSWEAVEQPRRQGRGALGQGSPAAGEVEGRSSHSGPEGRMLSTGAEQEGCGQHLKNKEENLNRGFLSFLQAIESRNY